MNDMSSVIVPKSDQINADDLIGRDMTITISDVQIKGGQEQPVSIFFDGSDKAFRPCKSMSRVLVAAWGADAKQYSGRSLTLYRDPTVKWGGLDVGGIRISHMSHIDKPMTLALTATKGSRKPYTVKPMTLALTATKGSRKPYTVKPLALTAESALTLDDAELDLRNAATLDELSLVWRRKAMAPFRAQLQSVLDERKSALQSTDASPSLGDAAGTSPKSAEPVAADEPGRADRDTGETTTLESAMAEIDAAETVFDVERRRDALLPLLGDDDADLLREHAAERVAALKGRR